MHNVIRFNFLCSLNISCISCIVKCINIYTAYTGLYFSLTYCLTLVWHFDSHFHVNKTSIIYRIVANHDLFGAIDPLFPPTQLGREGTRLHVMHDDEIILEFHVVDTYANNYHVLIVCISYLIAVCFANKLILLVQYS